MWEENIAEDLEKKNICRMSMVENDLIFHPQNAIYLLAIKNDG